MLEDLIKTLTPEAIASTIRSNPMVVPSVLTKFEAFVAFSQALSVEQQIYISANLSRLTEFFKDPEVKQAIGVLADAFIKKTE